VGPPNFLLSNFAGDINVSSAVVGSQTVATLTFSGTGVESGSLSDGLRTLTVTRINGLAGQNTFTFHRLFGDADANRTLPFPHYQEFAAAFGTQTNLAVFDWNADGVINTTDFIQFRMRLGHSV